MEKRWPFVLCELRDATVLGRAFTPVCNNVLLSDCLSYFGPTQLKRLAQRSDDAPWRTGHVEKAFLLGGDRTFGHTISAIVMRTLYLQLFDHLKELPVISMAGMPSTCYEIFKIFGCPSERLILLQDDDALVCDELYVPTVTGGVPPEGDVWSIPGELTRIYRDLIVGACGGPLPAEPSKAVYIVRGDTKTKLVLNDIQVIAFLEGRGYEVVDPSSMTLAEQVRLAQETKFFVSSIGSQVHLADFAKPGAKILMFGREDHVSQRVHSAVKRWKDLGIPLFTLLCEADEDTNLTVDLGQLTNALDQLNFQ